MTTISSPDATEVSFVRARGPVEETEAEPMYFGDGRRLFGWYHGAHGAQRDCGVVICGPLGYEELCAHRALRHWADALACSGISTLRFDYDGTGSSAGSDGDSGRVAAWISSIGEAVKELRARSGVRHVTLLGVRLGGTLAMAAAERVGADALILFAATITGRAYAREIRALGRLMRGGAQREVEASTSAVEQVAGFVVTEATMADLSALDPLAAGVGVRRAYIVPRDDMSADTSLADRLSQSGVTVERAGLPGYTAMMVDAHESIAPRAVIDASVQWLTASYETHEPGRASRATSRCVDLVEGMNHGGVRECAAIFSPERGLFGMLSESTNASARRGTGIVLANAGSVHSVGPGRLYVELAREWAARGFTVLRMDVGGVGESETRPGGIDNHPYPDHAVEDIGAAARWMIERAGVERVVIAGLCSGAHASFHAGLDLDGIAGVMIINPIVFYWNPSCALDVSAWMNYYESRRYAQSVREVDSWKRLVRGEVNVRYAAGVGYRRLREVTNGAVTALWKRLGVRRDADDVGADLGRMSQRGVDVLLVFSEGDPGLDFVRRRHARDVRLLEKRRANFAMRVVADADHTYTRADARERLSDLLTAHLIARHGGSRGDATR